MKEDSNKNYVPIGLCFGIIFGAACNNLIIGMCIGLAIGAAINHQKKKKSQN